MLHTLLSISDDPYFFAYVVVFIIGAIVGYFMLRASVRADAIVKNQEATIWFLILLCQKHGASEEEIQKLKDHFQIK